MTFDSHVGLEMRGDVLRDVRSEGIEDRSSRVVGNGNLADCQLEPMHSKSEYGRTSFAPANVLRIPPNPTPASK